jgi:adenylate cyclase class 2
MTETEIKLRVRDAAELKRRLRQLGWHAARRRDERNFVYDRPDGSLKAAGYLLRVREIGKRCALTVKAPTAAKSIHKVREEYEIQTRDTGELRRILEALGYQLSWRYDKFRTSFRKPDAGKIELDQTPIGDFVELEGEPAWIDQTAAELGFSKDEYITKTYAELFFEYRDKHPGTGDDMVFHDR